MKTLVFTGTVIFAILGFPFFIQWLVSYYKLLNYLESAPKKYLFFDDIEKMNEIERKSTKEANEIGLKISIYIVSLVLLISIYGFL